MIFHRLQINLIHRETPNAVKIGFEIPSGLKSNYEYIAGQYLTLKTDINGEEIRRDYSICSNPESGLLQIVVKKVDSGLFSNYANSELKEGDSIEVAEPQGRFTYSSDRDSDRKVVAFAAGSGITPVMGIMKSLLENESKSSFTLIYGNQNRAETIFYEEILNLTVEYPGRLKVFWVFSKAPEDEALFGRIDEGISKYFLNKIEPLDDVDSFFICGPGGMIETVSGVLKNAGINPDKIRFELFTPMPSQENISHSASREGMCHVEVIVDDEEAEFEMPKDKTVLEIALKEGIDAPYSCQGGICSSCIARLTEGEVKMRQNNILTDGEIADGLILTCQAEPVSDKIKVDYDDV